MSDVLYFFTVSGDSPSFSRISDAMLPSTLKTWSFPSACRSALARGSWVAQLMARRVTSYLVPTRAIEPSNSTVLLVRWQISRVISGVSLTSGAFPMKCKVCWIVSSGTTLRNGDCSNSTDRPLRSVPSNTESQVVFVKSARTMLSLSASFAGRRRRKNPARTATTATSAVPAIQVTGFPRRAGIASSPTTDLPCAAEVHELGGHMT
jgi:hypothetical protein